MRKTLLFILLTAVCISLPVSVRSEEGTPGKSASIPSIRVSEQNITFDQSITITVEVRNTSVKTSWYWIGLSFCGPLSRERPVGWFDVPALKSSEIEPLETCEVKFEFDIPFYMPEGPYDAVSAAWGDYDAENDRMIDRFGERTLKRAFFVTATGKDKDPYNISQHDSGGLFSSIPIGNRYELDDLIRTKNEGVYKSNPVGLLSEEDSNITVMIHGWIGLDMGDNEPFQSSGWRDLRSAYNEKCPPGWSLVEYQWASDADTGLIFRRNQVRDHNRTVPWYTFPKYRGEARAVIASERAYQHGMLLGAKIVEQVGASNLKMVHIICHSAGTWAGYAALRHIRANAPATEVQITYLDPFIPSRTVLYQSHRFNENVLRKTPSYAMVKTKGAAKCELYYAVDTMTTDAFSPATSVDWDWSNEDNAEVLRTDGLFSIRWDGHGGPQKFYADSITDPDKEKIKKLGWNLSLEKCSENDTLEQNQNAQNPRIEGEYMTNSIGMKFKKIPAGLFMMGSPDGEEGRSKKEGPVRKVTISKPFYIGIYEVTQVEYETVISSNPSKFKGDRNRPVETVSWYDAVNFCKKMSEKDTEWEYRLPTEAEWEYCYRAGTKTPYYWGQQMDDAYCWYSQNSGGITQQVGTKKPNAWGLYDMAGNVWEWCNDWYADFYPTIDQTDPPGPSGGYYRVLRGGSWVYVAPYCRAAYRLWNTPADRNAYLGFRVVAVPKPIKTAINNDTMINQIGMKFKKIPAGSFMMGSPDYEEGRDENEGPVRKVTISKPFYMGIYEVTQSEYEAVTGSNPSNFKGDRNRPVETVSWYDAVNFCEKMSEKDTEWEYRLPTEAEWEYCYRAGTKTAFYWGQEFDDAYCWYSQNSGGTTQQVGTKKPNAWGLYDMAGNVWEWCNDWYAEFYPTIDQTDPPGPSGGQYRILRGGSWGNIAPYYRAAHRGINTPDERGRREYSFRVVAVQKPIETAINNDTMINQTGMKFKKIPAGSFMMGSPESEAGRNKNEFPVRKVTISKPFYMGIYEVTQSEYEAVTGSNLSCFKNDRSRPVVTVSWHDAVFFCEKMSEKDTEWEYRLPTEAEWEYCYRAGTKTAFYWGQEFDEAYCWCSQNSGGTTQTVGRKKPNAWGLYDMAGNVSEWCSDWYSEFYPAVNQTDPIGPANGECAMVRGGSWNSNAPGCRAAFRDGYDPRVHFSDWGDIGFRVVAVPKPSETVVKNGTLINQIGMKFNKIAAGSFMMGSNNGRRGEKPVHKVTITKSFWMGATEVTQSQWRAVMSNNPSFFRGDDLPVETVTWDDAVEFCQKLTEREKANSHAGYEYRLPTEAEWEYCCRAGTTTEYCFGDNYELLGRYSWFWNNSVRKTHPIASKKSNSWGLYDMHGNVWEWCLDWIGDYTPNDQTDPQGPENGQYRVLRGGSKDDDGMECRAACRRSGFLPRDIPGNRSNFGFRVVASPRTRK